MRVLRIIGVGCLVLTMLGGIVGTANPMLNINMPLFWVVFLLGLTYLTAFIGNIYEFTNPWRHSRRWRRTSRTRSVQESRSYPHGLGYLPAFALYVGLVWIELFMFPQPEPLASLVDPVHSRHVFAVLLFGKHVWFEYGELFSVFFRMVGTLAPVQYVRASEDGRRASACACRLSARSMTGRGTSTLVLFVCSCCRRRPTTRFMKRSSG